jgi:hypothetical protein
METKFLLPYHFKRVGWFLLVPFFTIGILYLKFGEKMDLKFLEFDRLVENGKANFSEGDWLFTLKSNNFTDEIICIGLLIGLIFTAFSKEKMEDEWVAKVRLDSILWAVYLNTILLLLCIVFLYGVLFWQVMILNLFTTLLFFLIRFRYVMWQSAKDNKNELAV